MNMSAELPVNVYIDGYNFYYSIHNTSNRDLSRLKRGWCDFLKLSNRLLREHFPGMTLGALKYFTSPVGDLGDRTEEERRQQLWLDALGEGTNNRVTIIRGFYAKEEGKLRVEKQTDVNIAISIVRDSIMSPEDIADDKYRTDPLSPCSAVILISGDRDFEPALRMAKYYGIRTVRVDPRRDLSDDMLQKSLLPDVIERQSGRPLRWEDYAILKSGRW